MAFPGKDIEALIDDGGDIALGHLRPFDCVAAAADDHRGLVMLVRRDGETLNALLKRRDKAIGLAWTDNVLIDEVNNGHSDLLSRRRQLQCLQLRCQGLEQRILDLNACMNNTLLKGLAVLELLSRGPWPLSLTQIGKELGMGKSNVHRLMQALVETRFVLRDEEHGTYTPSIKLWELGSAVLGKLDLRRHAERHMESLMELTGESVHLSVLDGIEVVYVHKVDSAKPVRAYTQIGGRGPSYCVATGKAQLAFAREHVLDSACAALKQHTGNTITERGEFLKDMQKVRQRGYATNRAEFREEVWGIAAPILGMRGFVIAAVGVSGPASGFPSSVMPAWAEAVIGTAREISDALGSGREPAALNRLRFSTPTMDFRGPSNRK